MSVLAFTDRALLAASVPRRRIGIRIMCMGFGLITASLYLQNIAWRRLLWGPDGMLPSAPYGARIISEQGPTLYLLSSTTTWFEFIFWSGLLVTLLWAAGVFPVLTGPLYFTFTWSLLVRNVFIQDAGWNLLRILMLYLIVADCSFAALATIRIPALAARVPRVLVLMRGMLHNGAVALILFQLCLVYTASVFFKIQGHKWQDGTALYYILRTNQFNLSAIGSLIWHSGFLVAMGTYGTLLFQAAYPFWIWQRPYKYIVALAAVGFHVGILVTMALPFFAAIMIATEAILFSDDEYRRAYAWLRSRFAARRAAVRDESAPTPALCVYDR